jgi:2-(1,2-epoxy-1,2-dihydrophenyl)acetyl-CoA isomerase
VTRTVDTGTDVVLAEVRDRMGVITLNRPDRMNALHRDMYPAIKEVLTKFEADDEVSVVVLTGAGKGFCAGGDVRDGAARREGAEPVPTDTRVTALTSDAKTAQAFWDFPKLTVSAVNGAAAGAGASLALCTDLRVASSNAKLLSGWNALAFTGDFGGIWFLEKLIGHSRALEFAVSGEPLTADRGLAMGVFNAVLPSETFANDWPTWVAKFANAPLSSSIGMKANVRDAITLPISEYLAIESERMVHSGTTQDHKAAVKAWFEARKK